MIKHLIVTLFFILFSSITFSQDKLTISKKTQIIESKKSINQFFKLVGKEATFRVSVKEESKVGTRGVGRLIVEVENHETKKITKHELEEHYTFYWDTYSKKIKRYFYEDLLEDDKGKVWLFLSTFSETKHKLYRRELKADGTLGKNIFVTEKDNLKVTSGTKVANSLFYASAQPYYIAIDVKYKIKQSENKKAYSIITYRPDPKKKKTKFDIEVRDQDFQTLWKMSNYLDAESKSASFKNEDLILTDSGLLIGLIKARNSDQRNDIFYKLYVFQKGKQQYMDYVIYHEEKNLHGLKITESVDQHIIVSGFYNKAKRNSYNRIEGVYFLNLDTEPLQLVTETFSPFTEEQLEQILVPEIRPFFANQRSFKSGRVAAMKRARAQKNTTIDEDHYLLKLISHKNNTFTLVSENIESKKLYSYPTSSD
ncbi:hypothetical protein, partial [Flammeovirga sp. OC4]|uniref:hypothetical protein n=1 Tax=Flammeovirga sp. OC4 TaxID=1382345 RepID=UPI0012E00972